MVSEYPLRRVVFMFEVCWQVQGERQLRTLWVMSGKGHETYRFQPGSGTAVADGCDTSEEGARAVFDRVMQARPDGYAAIADPDSEEGAHMISVFEPDSDIMIIPRIIGG